MRMAGHVDIVTSTLTVTYVNFLTQSVLTASYQHHHMPIAIHSHSHALDHTRVTDGNMLHNPYRRAGTLFLLQLYS